MALVGQRTNTEREAGIFHYGKVFRVEPKGILSTSWRKRVHMKATSLRLFNPLMVLLNVFLRFSRYGLQ
jgi:hypothetical protein